jgi:hypothetical protein
MGKRPSSPQNGEVPSALSHDAVAPARQRPEEILAQTLSAAPHPEATDGWSSRGRRIFLVAMAVAGVILVVAGLLVTKELAPGPGRPTPLESGPGNGLADQLLQSSAGVQPPAPADAQARDVVRGLLPATPTTRPAREGATSSPGAVSPALPTQPSGSTQSTPGTTVPPPSPTTTVPCGGLLGPGLQQAQIPLPCRAPANSPLGSTGL